MNAQQGDHVYCTASPSNPQGYRYEVQTLRRAERHHRHDRSLENLGLGITPPNPS